MNGNSKILAILGAIALTAAPAASQPIGLSGADDFLAKCEALRGLSRVELESFIAANPTDPCIEVAALLITQASTGGVGDGNGGNY